MMALRLVEIFLPAPKDDAGQDKTHEDHLQELLKDLEAIGVWQQKLADDRTNLRVLIETQTTEALLEAVDKHFAWQSDYRVVLLPVEGTEPRLPEKKPAKPEVVGISSTAPRALPWASTMSRNRTRAIVART